MSKRNKKGVYCLSLRLPQVIAKEVQKRSKAQNRSLNGQIVFELEVNGRSQTTGTASSSQTATVELIGIPKPETQTV